MILRLTAVLRDELASSLMEYALLASLIAMTCLVGIKLVGTNTGANLTQSSTAIVGASSAASSTPTSGSGNAKP